MGFLLQRSLHKQTRDHAVNLHARIQCPDTGFIGETQTGYISTNIVLHPASDVASVSAESTSWSMKMDEESGKDVVLCDVKVEIKPAESKPLGAHNVKFVSFLFPTCVEDVVFEHGI